MMLADEIIAVDETAIRRFYHSKQTVCLLRVYDKLSRYVREAKRYDLDFDLIAKARELVNQPQRIAASLDSIRLRESVSWFEWPRPYVANAVEPPVGTEHLISEIKRTGLLCCATATGIALTLAWVGYKREPQVSRISIRWLFKGDEKNDTLEQLKAGYPNASEADIKAMLEADKHVSIGLSAFYDDAFRGREMREYFLKTLEENIEAFQYDWQGEISYFLALMILINEGNVKEEHIIPEDGMDYYLLSLRHLS